MPKLQISDLEMHYTAHGPEDGEPLILLHGFLSTGQMFEPFIEPLAGKYRLYIPDWRGHGRTTNPAGEIVHAQLARDAAAFAAALGIQKAHFCGHSSGGMYLQFLALANPDLVHSLTLASATYTFDEHAKQSAAQTRKNFSPGIKEYFHSLHADTHGPDYVETLLDLWVASVHRPDELPFTPKDLAQISCPTLIIHGDRDSFFPVRIPLTMYQAIPNAELCIAPNTDHLLTEESPDIFLITLLDFLGRNPME